MFLDQHAFEAGMRDTAATAQVALGMCAGMPYGYEPSLYVRDRLTAFLLRASIGNGGVIGPRQTPSILSAPGVWLLEEAQQAQADGIWALPSYEVEFLIVAGGGGGGARRTGGGGGAGGYRCSVAGEPSGGGASAEAPKRVLRGTGYPIVVGAGGPPGANGGDSSFDAIVSVGGGAGGDEVVFDGVSGKGFPGGSGGGSRSNENAGSGAGTEGQGFRGGNQTAGSIRGTGGGGGSQTGNDRPASDTGKGGDGVESSITGSPVVRAGGGGGGSAGGDNPAGGDGGGGSGANSSNAGATAGAANSGGGGGGGGGSSGATAGGSGVVIIRYPGPQRATGGTVTTAGGYTIHAFTTSGAFTA